MWILHAEFTKRRFEHHLIFFLNEMSSDGPSVDSSVEAYAEACLLCETPNFVNDSWCGDLTLPPRRFLSCPGDDDTPNLTSTSNLTVRGDTLPAIKLRQRPPVRLLSMSCIPCGFSCSVGPEHTNCPDCGLAFTPYIKRG